ncbi:unnamed protein product [Arctogadus glacialis]
MSPLGSELPGESTTAGDQGNGKGSDAAVMGGRITNPPQLRGGGLRCGMPMAKASPLVIREVEMKNTLALLDFHPP